MAKSLQDTYDFDDSTVPSVLDLIFGSTNKLIDETKGNVQQLPKALPATQTPTPVTRTGSSSSAITPTRLVPSLIPTKAPTLAPTRIPTMLPTGTHR